MDWTHDVHRVKSVGNDYSGEGRPGIDWRK